MSARHELSRPVIDRNHWREVHIQADRRDVQLKSGGWSMPFWRPEHDPVIVQAKRGW
jgi:hypothetical protein